MKPNLYNIILVFISGNSDCVKLLITMGACLESYDLYYGTPLHVACVNEHIDCVKVLLNAGEYQCMCLNVALAYMCMAFRYSSLTSNI